MKSFISVKNLPCPFVFCRYINEKDLISLVYKDE